MDRLEIRLLGGFEVRHSSGEPMQVPSTKASLLLAYLALRPHETHRRDKLVALLWSERDEKQARANLRQALWILRKSMEILIPPLLVSEGEAVGLDGSAVWVDAVQFERLIDDGSPEALEQAAALYKGDLLEGVQVRDPGFEEFLFYERERLRSVLLQALHALLDDQCGRDRPQLAVQTAQWILAMDPLDEGVHRTLIRLHQQQGHYGQALRQYEHCRETLARELDLVPSPETERLISEMGREHGEQEEAPAISDPAETFETTAPAPATDGLAPAQSPRREAKRRRRWPALAAAALVVGAVVGSVVWWRHGAIETLPTATDDTVLPLPDQPSIAVLPFDNLSGDPQQDYFSDGIADDLITGLAKFDKLFVIDRKSSFAYRGTEVAGQQVARDLGVAHLLQGSVRRDGDRVRINAQLIDAASGRHLWAEHYDGRVSGIFAMQGSLIEGVVAALGVSSGDSEQRHLTRIPTDNLKAYDYYLRAEQEGYYLPDPATLNKALSYYSRAIELDPEFAEAHAGLARTAVELWRHYPNFADIPTIFGPPVARQRAYDAAGKALVLDPENAVAYSVLALLQLGDSRHEEAVDSAQKAAALAPSNADAHAALAQVLAYAGKPREAMAAVETALRLDPKGTAGLQLIAGIVHYTAKDYAKAVAALEAARDAPPDDETSRLYLAAAYAHQGRMTLAGAEIDALLGIVASSSLAYYELFYEFYRREEDRHHHLEGLKKAGLPFWPYGFKGSAQDLVAGEELLRLVLDQTWLGRHENGVEFLQHTDKQGRVAYRSATSFVTGVTRIKGDMLCQRFDFYSFDRDLCGRVFRNPESGDKGNKNYIYASPDSLKYFSLLE